MLSLFKALIASKIQGRRFKLSTSKVTVVTDFKEGLENDVQAVCITSDYYLVNGKKRTVTHNIWTDNEVLLAMVLSGAYSTDQLLSILSYTPETYL
tara:strand:+ start:453 stop:740 length:288 start_codon:yes stop_codon:yes gene_type:complete